MNFLQRFAQGFRIAGWRFREYLEFDSKVFKRLLGFGTLASAGVLLACRRRSKAFSLLARLHRAAFPPWAPRRVEGLLTTGAEPGAPRGPRDWVIPIYRGHIEQSVFLPAVARFLKQPQKFFESMAIVLKSP